MGLTAGGFSWKSWKNDIRPNCFWETGRILIKYGLESIVFCREWLLRNYGHQKGDLFVKIGKKGYPTDFFDPEYKVVLTDSTFFWSKMGMTAGKIGKKGHPKDFFDPEYNVVLTDFTFFWLKTGMTAGGFSCKIWK